MNNIIKSCRLKTENSHIDISIEKITPKMAKQLLENNHKNQRKLNKKTYIQYAQQMKKGLWKSDNGESIKLSKNGEEILDGQHRLAGIIESDIPITMMIMRNLESDLNELDLGKKRNLSDLLVINGSKIPVSGLSEGSLSAFIDGLWHIVQYTKRSHNQNNTTRYASRTTRSPIELFNFFQENPQIVSELSNLKGMRVATLGNTVPLTGNLLGWYVISQMGDEAKVIANTIFATLRDGTPKTENGYKCPAYVLLKQILKLKDDKVYFRKEEYLSLWIWTYEKMADNKTSSKILLNHVHKPGQGHINSKLLIEKFKQYKF